MSIKTVSSRYWVLPYNNKSCTRTLGFCATGGDTCHESNDQESNVHLTPPRLAGLPEHTSNRSMLSRESMDAIPVGGRGMVLPFEPLSLTFHDMNYYVPLPSVRQPGFY